MTEDELKYAIGETDYPNKVHEFYDAARKLCGYKRITPAVCALAWRLYVESVKDEPNPVADSKPAQGLSS
jgi:hypothetical protein